MGSHVISQAGEVRRVLDGLRRVVQLLRASSVDAEKKLGLSSAQLFVLSKLRDHGHISLGKLALLTNTHQSSVSVVVARLVDRDLVTRRASKSDGRRLELSLTARGRRLIERAPDAAQERLADAIEALPPAWRMQLARALDRIAGGAGVPPMFFEGEQNHE
jgi:DNA-binding MarR family transcriptional regulator